MLVPEVVVESSTGADAGTTTRTNTRTSTRTTTSFDTASEVIEKSDRGWVWMLLAFVLGFGGRREVGGFVLAKIQNSKAKPGSICGLKKL